MSLLAIASATQPKGSGFRALYLIPHQDDETLTCGAAILSEIAAGHEVVCLLATKGEKAGNNMSTLLGRSVSGDEVRAARDKEFVEACTRLGASPIISPDREPDAGSTVDGIVALAKKMVPRDKPLLLRSTSQYDYHVDHRNCGFAMARLAEEGFGIDPRHMVAGRNVRLVRDARPGKPIAQMGKHGDVTEWHQWGYRHVEPEAGWFGIGYSSAGPWFEEQIKVDGRTHWHTLK